MSNSLRRQISRPRNLTTTPFHMLLSSSDTPPPLSPHLLTPNADSNLSPLSRSPQKPPPTPTSTVSPSPRQLSSSKLSQYSTTISSSSMVNASSQRLCLVLTALSVLPSLYVIYWSNQVPTCNPVARPLFAVEKPIDLLSFSSAWNHLSFSASPPPATLKIALFVKKWPHVKLAGGLERHALTLHLALARRGHELHVFTANTSHTSTTPLPTYPNARIHVHVTPPSPAGLINQPLAWEQLLLYNSTGGRPFDVIHTESVSLFHGRARNISNLAVSWHGIAYETIHSDIVEDLLRGPDEPRKAAIAERVSKVVDEVRFFQNYAHHVATSDHVGDVLRRVYMIPEERVHVILNGVDEEVYKPDISEGRSFRREIGLPEEEASLVIGLAGRLVRDKGHPIMFEALKQLFQEEESFRKEVYVLVAGDGPWKRRYKSLEPNLFILGTLEQTRLAKFYDCLDVFVNPTLRAQGLDHTFLEAMLSGVPVMGTRFASITGSIVLGPDMGYTFLPTVPSLKEALRGVWREGKGSLRQKGEAARRRALGLFTASKMASAYERLFLCMAHRPTTHYCTYPLLGDRS